MKIYIDFDDVLCETAEYFTKIAKELFDIDVPYRQVQFFNLQKSFDLNDEQYEALMKAGHLPENLLNYEETPGQLISGWIRDTRFLSLPEGRSIPTNHRGNGLMNIIWKEFPCSA